MRAAATVVELRQLLSERFPQAHGTKRGWHRTVVATGLANFDALLGGGLPKGEISELVGTRPGSGSAQVIHALLRCAASDGQFLALVDGADSFDVDAVEHDVLSRLLWVRCAKVEEALKAADLLLRDRNFPLVVLDLKLNPLAQLRKIPSNVWHRFRRLLEQNGAAMLAVTPTPLIGGAVCRVRVECRAGIEALAQPPSEVLGQLHFELLGAAECSETVAEAQAG